MLEAPRRESFCAFVYFSILSSVLDALDAEHYKS